MYFVVFTLRRQDKQYFSFSLLNIFSSLFLIFFFIAEYPIFTSGLFSYLLVQKLFRGIAGVLSSFFAVSFMRDYIGYNESLTRKIYRTALTIGPCFFLGFTQNMHDFFLYLRIKCTA